MQLRWTLTLRQDDRFIHARILTFVSFVSAFDDVMDCTVLRMVCDTVCSMMTMQHNTIERFAIRQPQKIGEIKSYHSRRLKR